MFRILSATISITLLEKLVAFWDYFGDSHLLLFLLLSNGLEASLATLILNYKFLSCTIKILILRASVKNAEFEVGLLSNSKKSKSVDLCLFFFF